jgi:hypothetical protein
VDDDRGGIGGSLQLDGPGSHGRVHDPLKISPGERICEDDLARRDRLSCPSLSASLPNRSTIAASAGVPGFTTSRASTSASMMIAPRSASSAATRLFPDAITAGQTDPHHVQQPMQPWLRSGSDRFSAQQRRNAAFRGQSNNRPGSDQLPPVSF